MVLAVLVVSALALIVGSLTLFFLVRLIALSVDELAILRAQVDLILPQIEQVKQDEIAFLRAQNSDLHERLLAVLNAGAQARLAAQREPVRLRPIAEHPLVPTRARNGLQVDLPPSPPEPEP